jgi:hypothetical protein
MVDLHLIHTLIIYVIISKTHSLILIIELQEGSNPLENLRKKVRQ